MLSGLGLNLSSQPGRVRLQRIISNNSCAHDEQGDNFRNEKEGLETKEIYIAPFVL